MKKGLLVVSMSGNRVMNVDELRDFFERPPGKGLPLCRVCGGAHEGECPPIDCTICGTTHKRNEPFIFNNCEYNDRFRQRYRGIIEWRKENTRQIWAQPDKEPEEE